MTRLFAAELLKLRTIRATWGYFLTTIGLAALVSAGTIGSASEFDRFGSDFQSRLVTDAAGATTILALLLGITLVTNEFRHGTITPTLLVTPRRSLLLAGKLLAASAVGIALVLVALLVIAAIAAVWLGVLDVPLELGDAAEAGSHVLVSAVVAGALGAAYGGIVHAQVGAIVGALVWLFIAEPLLGGLLSLLDAEGMVDYLPRAVLFAIADPAGDALSFGPAVGVGLVQVVVATGFALLRTGRRDIS